MRLIVLFSCLFIFLLHASVSTAQNLNEPENISNSTNEPIISINICEQQNNTLSLTDQSKNSTDDTKISDIQTSNSTPTNQIILAYDPITNNVIILIQDPDLPLPDDLNKMNVLQINIVKGKDVIYFVNENKDIDKNIYKYRYKYKDKDKYKDNNRDIDNDKLANKTLSQIMDELGINFDNNSDQIEIEFELEEIDILLDNDITKAVLEQYNITKKTSRVSIVQYEIDNTIIVKLNNKMDGTWYRLTAYVSEDREITDITVRCDDGTTRQISNWTRNGTAVKFYDDPASVYEIHTTQQTITFPPGGASNGSVMIEIPRSANVIDMRFDINTSDTLTNLNLDVGSNGIIEWGPVNFSSSNGTLTLNNSNAGLIDAMNALIPLVDNNAVGVNYTYNTTTNNVTIELNFSSDSQGSLSLSNIYVNYTLWQNLYGNVSGNITLYDGSNDLYNWALANYEGNVYITDIDSEINWSSLRALGKKTDGSTANTDFIDVSQNLYMQPGLNLSDAFSSDGTYALNTTSFTVYGSTITDVPCVNSTNRDNHNLVSAANFITGIMWDSSDDGSNDEYDTSDDEDIVFVTSITSDMISETFSSPHDYEFILPSNFGSYKGTDDSIVCYIDFK